MHLGWWCCCPDPAGFTVHRGCGGLEQNWRTLPGELTPSRLLPGEWPVVSADQGHWQLPAGCGKHQRGDLWDGKEAAAGMRQRRPARHDGPGLHKHGDVAGGCCCPGRSKRVVPVRRQRVWCFRNDAVLLCARRRLPGSSGRGNIQRGVVPQETRVQARPRHERGRTTG